MTQMSFEDMLKELETLVRRFENGQMPLNDAVAAYERGISLHKDCQNLLQQAKAKIEHVTASQNGASAPEERVTSSAALDCGPAAAQTSGAAPRESLFSTSIPAPATGDAGDVH